jgi:hypothetical protein
MANVTGPLFSLTAKGSIAKTLNFRAGKRGTVASKHSKPGGPASPAQIAHRHQFADLAALWNATPDEAIDTFAAIAGPDEKALYNTFVAENFRRLAQGLCPTQYHPVPDDYYPVALAIGRGCRPSQDPTGAYMWTYPSEFPELYSQLAPPDYPTTLWLIHNYEDVNYRLYMNNLHADSDPMYVNELCQPAGIYHAINGAIGTVVVTMF